jgi:hypothetical protein
MTRILLLNPSDEVERDVVLQPAIGGDAVPITINHLGKLLIGLEPLPLG